MFALPMVGGSGRAPRESGLPLVALGSLAMQAPIGSSNSATLPGGVSKGMGNLRNHTIQSRRPPRKLWWGVWLAGPQGAVSASYTVDPPEDRLEALFGAVRRSLCGSLGDANVNLSANRNPRPGPSWGRPSGQLLGELPGHTRPTFPP